MPWSDYDETVKQFSGLIQLAAHEGIGTALTNSLLKASADAAGLKTSFATYRDATRLYSSFSQGEHATDRFAAALDTLNRTGIDQGVTGDMIGRMPWSPDDNVWNLGQRVTARVEYRVATPFGPETSFFSLSYTRSQLTTVGAVVDDAQSFLDSSGTESPPVVAVLTGRVEFTRSH